MPKSTVLNAKICLTMLCLSGFELYSRWVPLNFTFLLVDFTKVLCSSANELQQNSNASCREEYIPQY